MRSRATWAIGRELVEQTGGAFNVFCGAVGTAGMLTGVSRALKAGGCGARIVALEPASRPDVDRGKGGAHRVEGIAPGSSRRICPRTCTATKPARRAGRDARQIARRLAREEGVFVGTSSALNVAAALQLARELGPGRPW